MVGIVLNERNEPVATALVHAFPAQATLEGLERADRVPFATGVSGSAVTDKVGRFRISGLEQGEYLVAAETQSPIAGASTQPLYATTFHPAAIDYREAVVVTASSEGSITIRLVPVQGVRISGSVVNRSGGSVRGLSVRLFHGFGGSGRESTVATINDDGTFEASRVPPGWYRLTVAPPQTMASTDNRRESATTVIEVRDNDIDDLSLVLGAGASVSGRVLPEPGTAIESAVGLDVTAAPPPEQFGPSGLGTLVAVAFDWSFRMTGLSGSYQFFARSSKPPWVKATRVVVDGTEAPADRGVELTDGNHDVLVFIAFRDPSPPAFDRTVSTTALVEQFKNASWQQLDIANEIADRRDRSVLPSLAPWLSYADRHVRGNAAFIFSRLGDPRGLQIIADMLTDRSDRPQGQITGGNWSLQAQIRSDRYYAVHLLGELRDPRAIPVLVPLLKDPDVNYKVPWALGRIGDRRAVVALLDTLDDDSPGMRVSAIYALEELNAREAVPRLMSLLGDERTSTSGAPVSVADAARAAIAKLK